MSEKGLSPRQKMINLMYLFLTALLAINVSAEILNAFIVIDKSIRKSTESINDKNEILYKFFEQAYKDNPKKVEKWYNFSKELKQKTQELDSVIQEYKWKLVKTADGPEGNIEDVKKKDDNNVGGQIMILEKGGIDLKNKYNDYKAFLLSIISDTSKVPVLVNNILSTFSTDDVQSINEKNTQIPWEVANFEHLPLIAVIAVMSKMQNDIHNIEADLLAYMQGQVDIGAWKFNKIAAIVNAPNSYVKVGEEFTAEVFIAAYDSTQEPTVILKNGTKLSTQNGKGIYKGSTATPGKFDIMGSIKLKAPTGDTVDFPFQSSYEVVASTFAISPTKMNVFYIGVENPVSVTATGRQISATISGSGGTIKNVGTGKYIVTVKQTGKAVVTAIADGKPAGTMEFRCLPVPDPYATVGGKRGGPINKAELLSASFVKAQLDNFVFDLTFPVVSFSVSVTVGGYTEDVVAQGANITPQQKNLIQQLQKGSRVYFENIKAKAPDGSIRNLGTVGFKIN